MSWLDIGPLYEGSLSANRAIFYNTFIKAIVEKNKACGCYISPINATNYEDKLLQSAYYSVEQLRERIIEIIQTYQVAFTYSSNKWVKQEAYDNTARDWYTELTDLRLDNTDAAAVMSTLAYSVIIDGQASNKNINTLLKVEIWEGLKALFDLMRYHYDTVSFSPSTGTYAYFVTTKGLNSGPSMFTSDTDFGQSGLIADILPDAQDWLEDTANHTTDYSIARIKKIRLTSRQYIYIQYTSGAWVPTGDQSAQAIVEYAGSIQPASIKITTLDLDDVAYVPNLKTTGQIDFNATTTTRYSAWDGSIIEDVKYDSGYGDQYDKFEPVLQGSLVGNESVFTVVGAEIIDATLDTPLTYNQPINTADPGEGATDTCESTIEKYFEIAYNLNPSMRIIDTVNSALEYCVEP